MDRASQLSTPQPANGNPGTQPAAGAAAPDPAKQSDSFQRAYDLGKEVSVTRAAPGSIKRLSVAVLLRDPDKGRRTAMEINQIDSLVKSAVGFDQGRNDQVTVISRQFSPDAITSDAKPAWYQADWVPVAARNATALVIALLVLLLGVRPLAKALLKKREDASPGQGGLPATGLGSETERQTAGKQPVSVQMLANSRSYVMCQVVAAMDPRIVKNEGYFNAVDIIIPEGCIAQPPPNKPAALGSFHPACEITDPAQECPASTAGPSCASSARRVAATSSASEVSGFCTAVTL